MLATSHGWEMMASTWNAKSSTMVNNRPYDDHGPILGRNVFSYQFPPLAFSPKVRVRKPANNGMPRNTNTEAMIAQTENSAEVVSKPSQDGSSWK